VSATANTGLIASGGSGFDIRINGSGQTAFTRYQGFDANNTFTANFYVEGTWAYLLAEAGFTTALGNSNNPIYISAGKAVLLHTTGSYLYPVYPTSAGLLQVSGGAGFGGIINFQSLGSTLQFYGGSGGLTGKVTGGTTGSILEFITGTTSVQNTSNDFNGSFYVTSGTVTFYNNTIPYGVGKAGAVRIGTSTTILGNSAGGNWYNTFTKIDSGANGSLRGSQNIYGTITVNAHANTAEGLRLGVVGYTGSDVLNLYGNVTVTSSSLLTGDSISVNFKSGCTANIYRMLLDGTATSWSFENGSSLTLSNSISVTSASSQLTLAGTIAGSGTLSVSGGGYINFSDTFNGSGVSTINVTASGTNSTIYVSQFTPNPSKLLSGTLTMSSGAWLRSNVGSQTLNHSTYNFGGTVTISGNFTLPTNSSGFNLTSSTFFSGGGFIDIQCVVDGTSSADIGSYGTTLRLSNKSNTFLGSTTVGSNTNTGAVVEFDSVKGGGAASSLGQGSTAQPIAYFGPNGILRCIGEGGTSDRPFATNTAGIEPATYTRTIESSGTGEIYLNSLSTWTLEGSTETTLVLGGTFAPNVTGVDRFGGYFYQYLSSVVTGSMVIKKTGTGSWTLGTTITWTNATSKSVLVEQGLLAYVPFTSENVVVSSGATLSSVGPSGSGTITLNGYGVGGTLGALFLTSSASVSRGIVLGSSSSINVATSAVFGSTISGSGGSPAMTIKGSGTSNFTQSVFLNSSIGNFVKEDTGTAIIYVGTNHTGSTSVNGGTLECRSTTSTGTSSGNHVAVNGGTLRATANSGGKSLITKNLTFNGGSMTIG
jgi:hypothetical protein